MYVRTCVCVRVYMLLHALVASSGMYPHVPQVASADQAQMQEAAGHSVAALSAGEKDVLQVGNVLTYVPRMKADRTHMPAHNALRRCAVCQHHHLLRNRGRGEARMPLAAHPALPV